MAKRPIDVNLPERHRRRNLPRVAVYTDPRRIRRDRLIFALLVAGAVVALVASGLVPGLSFPSSGHTVPRPSAVGGLESRGMARNGSLVAGTPVRLTWGSSRGADRYRLQVASAAAGVSAGQVFGKLRLSALVRRPGYTWRPGKPGRYYWRVQAEASGRWGPYSAARPLVVAQPALGRPAPLSPRDWAHLQGRIHFCWSRVAGANRYQLRVDGRARVTSPGPCAWLLLRPGPHTWRVAALARGSATSAGSLSRPLHLTVLAPRHATAPRAASSPNPPATPQPVAASQPPAQVLPTQAPVATPRPVVAPAPQVTRPAHRISAPPAPIHQAPTQPPPTPAPPVQRAPAPSPPPAQQPGGTGQSRTPGCIPLFTC